MADTLGIVLASGGHAAAHSAFLMGAGAAALGRQVVLFAMGPGAHALCGAVQDPSREAALAAQGVATLAELLDAMAELGSVLLVCETALAAESIPADQVRAGAKIVGIASFLEATRQAQMLSF